METSDIKNLRQTKVGWADDSIQDVEGMKLANWIFTVQWRTFVVKAKTSAVVHTEKMRTCR